jgi:orotate phosphoribosyltransferase
MDVVSTEVVSVLKECGALLEGHFLLSSGRHSDRYFQCARLFLYPERAAEVLAPVAAAVRTAVMAGRIAVDSVCGPALGGIVAAYELGRQLQVPAFFTERDDAGAMTLRRGFAVAPGERVLIVEDVVTTGKSSGEARAAIEAAGGVVTAVACVVDRRSGDQGMTLPVFAACTVAAENWAPGECPLCAAGTPAMKPGSRKMV